MEEFTTADINFNFDASEKLCKGLWNNFDLNNLFIYNNYYENN